MEPFAISIIESGLGRDPNTGRKAFVLTHHSLNEPITNNTRDLPIETRIFEAQVRVIAVLGYLLLIIASPLAVALGWSLGQPLLGLVLSFVGFSAGCAIVSINPTIYRRGRLLRVMKGTIRLSKRK